MRVIITFLIILFVNLTLVVDANGQRNDISTDVEFKVVNDNGRKGLINAKGKVVVPIKYDDIGWSNGETLPTDNGIIGFKQNELWGLVSVSNKTISTAQYDVLISSSSKEFVIAKTQADSTGLNAYGVLNYKGKSVIPFNYSILIDVGDVLIGGVDKENTTHFGLINYSNEEVLPFKYNNIYPIYSFLLAVHKADGYIGLYNTMHQKFVADSLTKTELSENGYFKIYRGMKCGLINDEGEIIVPIDYKELRWKNNELHGLKYSKWLIYKGSNELVGEFDCDSISFKQDKVLLTGLNHDQLVDGNGKAITPGYLKKIIDVVGRQVVFKEGDKYGAYDGVKKEIVRRNVDSLRLIEEFYYELKKVNDKTIWAIRDTFQVKRNKFEYEAIKPHHNRLFAVKRNGKWGFIARNGFEVIPCEFDSVGEFVVNDVIARKGDVEGVISVSGRWLVQPRNERIELLNHIYFLSREKNGKTKLENVNGELVYFTDNKIEFRDNLLWEYRRDGSVIKIDLKGKLLTAKYNIENTEYEEIKFVYDDWVAVKWHGKYGFFDTKMGIIRISTRYEDVGQTKVRDKLIPVKILGKWGAVNRKEELIIQPNYDSIYSFINGMAITRINDKYGLINDYGKVIVQNRYEQMQHLDNGRYTTVEKGGYGLMDKDGKVIITNKYDSLNDTSNGYTIVKTNDKFGVVGLNGVNTIPSTYDNILFNPVSNTYYAKTEVSWEVINCNP